jgi:hypothetical protein
MQREKHEEMCIFCIELILVVYCILYSMGRRWSIGPLSIATAIDGLCNCRVLAHGTTMLIGVISFTTAQVYANLNTRESDRRVCV